MVGKIRPPLSGVIDTNAFYGLWLAQQWILEPLMHREDSRWLVRQNQTKENCPIDSSLCLLVLHYHTEEHPWCASHHLLYPYVCSLPFPQLQMYAVLLHEYVWVPENLLAYVKIIPLSLLAMRLVSSISLKLCWWTIYQCTWFLSQQGLSFFFFFHHSFFF